MVAHFYPETIFTIVTLSDLPNLMLPFEHNLIVNLPIQTICQWLAFNRLGSFVFRCDEIAFSPGINRRDIYSPILESIPIFELANLFHEYKIANQHLFLTLVMDYRNAFYNFTAKTHPTIICEIECFQTFPRAKPVNRNFPIRTKRKNRPSKGSTNIDSELFTYVTQKGHYDWSSL